MAKKIADPELSLHRFQTIYQATRNSGSPIRKALEVAGISQVVIQDEVIPLPDGWWFCKELRVYLPPVQHLPRLEGILRKFPNVFETV